MKKVRRKNLGIYWLNLVCSNKISKFYNPFYEKIKNFLYRISKDEYFIHINKESYINKQIDIIFNKLIEVIIDKIFDNSLNNYCKDINNNDITNFLKNPNKYLYEKISINIANELMENIDNKKDVINRIIDNIKKIENFKENELKTNIENELEIKNNDYKEIKEINNREKNDRLFKSFIKDLDKYKILFQELIGINKISSGFQNKIKESIELYDNLTKYFQKTIRKGEKLELLKINFSINIETNINILVKNKNDDETLLYEIEGYYGEFYIFNEPLEDIIFINKKNNKTLKEINTMQSKILLHSLILIEDENKLGLNNDNNFDSITLKFGSGSSLNEFYKYFSLYKNKLKELKDILSLLLEKKDVILNCNFNNKSYKKDINNFISLCSVKFSDNSKCESINKDLLELKINLMQILTDYNLISNHFSKLYETLEINTKFKNKFLEKNYKLNEITVKKPINDLVDFSKLNYDGCLSVPIINVDPQTYEIFCSIKEVKCSIGPIYPNLFSESYKINILNFSNCFLLLKLDKDYNIYNYDDYICDSPENLINFPEKIECNQTIEIELKLPKIKDNLNLKEIHFVKFNLEINNYIEKEDKPNNKPFKLPFIIKLELMPIILMFSTKNKKINLEDNKFYIKSDLYSEEIISFTLEQTEIQKKLKFQPFIQIEGLKDNNSLEPIINIHEEVKSEKNKIKIDLIMPNNNDKLLKINMAINLFYTEYFKIPIVINSDIHPFNYKLLTYDYNNRHYQEQNCIIRYNFKEKLEENHVLNINLKIEFPNEFLNKIFNCNFSIINNFKQCIEILNEEQFSEKKNIVNAHYFTLQIRINKTNFPLNNIFNIIFISEINSTKKQTEIIFINEENDIESINSFYNLDENIISNNDNYNSNNNIESDSIYFCIEDGRILENEEYESLKLDEKKNLNIINLRRDYINMEFNNFNIKLPDLEIKKTITSIMEIEDFYSECIKIVRALPSDIQGSLKKKDIPLLKKAEKLFCQIYEYYKELLPFNQKDNSILNNKIDNFKLSFISLVKKLYNSNLVINEGNIYDLFGVSEFELSNDIIQNEYIIEPMEIKLNIKKRKNEEFLRIKEKEKEKIPIIEIRNEIINEKNDLDDSFNYSQYETCNFLNGKFNDINPISKINYLDNYENIFNTYNNNNRKYFEDFEQNVNQNERIRNSFLQNYKKEITGSLKKIYLGNKEYVQKLKEEENNNEIIQNNNHGNNIVQEVLRGYKINENVTKTLLMNQDKFEDTNFSDSDGIQWVLQKIKKIEETDKLNLMNNEGYLPKNNQGSKNYGIKYPILNLSSYFLKLANEIFIEVSKLVVPENKTDILFTKICAILLIDSSCYINKKKKIFNFHILCSFAIVFHLLEIPYSIAVIADGKYKIILKQFEDQHSFEIFEKVYECLMIRRFRDNLANSQKFAKENFMFSKEKIKVNVKEKPKFYIEHPKKIIITITDGLDEELKLTKEWNNLIFNEKDISFGFIFYKPDLDKAEDEKQIDNLWESFIEHSKKAISKVIVYIINKEMKNISLLIISLIL